MISSRPVIHPVITGHAVFYPGMSEPVSSLTPGGPDTLDRIPELLEKTRARIQELERRGSPDPLAFESVIPLYRAMAEDPELPLALRAEMEKDPIGLREAIRRVFRRFETDLTTKDRYFSERRFDAIDFSGLMLDILDEREALPPEVFSERSVLVVDRLLATVLLPLDFSKIVAVLAREGGFHSHAAIVLNAKGIPFFFRDDLFQLLHPGDAVRIELDHYTLFVNEGPGIRLRTPDFSPSTERVDWPEGNLLVFPSLNDPRESLAIGMNSDVSGIGLVRTETLMLENRRFPSVEEQWNAYLPLVRQMDGKPVYFRLMDIEPDKRPPLGYGGEFGAAFLIAHPDLTRDQLRVIWRLADENPVGILFPMVRHPEEITILMRMVDQIRKEKEEPSHPVQVGAMVETREFAENLGSLAGLDFLTVGSNDLVCDLHGSCRSDALFSREWFREPEFLNLVSSLRQRTQLPLFICGEAANGPQSVRDLASRGIRRFCPAIHRISIFGKPKKD